MWSGLAAVGGCWSVGETGPMCLAGHVVPSRASGRCTDRGTERSCGEWACSTRREDGRGGFRSAIHGGLCRSGCPRRCWVWHGARSAARQEGHHAGPSRCEHGGIRHHCRKSLLGAGPAVEDAGNRCCRAASNARQRTPDAKRRTGGQRQVFFFSAAGMVDELVADLIALQDVARTDRLGQDRKMVLKGPVQSFVIRVELGHFHELVLRHDGCEIRWNSHGGRAGRAGRSEKKIWLMSQNGERSMNQAVSSCRHSRFESECDSNAFRYRLLLLTQVLTATAPNGC